MFRTSVLHLILKNLEVYKFYHCCPVKIHSVPDGTFNNFHLTLYQYLVPNGTVPEGLNIGRI